MTVLENTLASPATGSLRPTDPRRDLLAIADLVELCFRDTLDQDGFNYLRQMREYARHSDFLTWAYNFAETATSAPVVGYVWEEAGRIVGNVSLISLTFQKEHYYLIANVAVQPEYQGRGIGRRLTAAAVDYARNRQVKAAWLQVRADNGPAVHIYRQLGFRERSRRATWQTNPDLPRRPSGIGLQLANRRPQHAGQQRTWLEALYPCEIRWSVPLRAPWFETGLLRWLYQLSALEVVQHWAVSREGQPLGFLTWRPDVSSGQNCWLAGPSEPDVAALEALLCFARHKAGHRRLVVDVPADYAASPLSAAGFYLRQQLTWMEIAF